LSATSKQADTHLYVLAQLRPRPLRFSVQKAGQLTDQPIFRGHGSHGGPYKCHRPPSSNSVSTLVLNVTMFGRGIRPRTIAAAKLVGRMSDGRRRRRRPADLPRRQWYRSISGWRSSRTVVDRRRPAASPHGSATASRRHRSSVLVNLRHGTNTRAQLQQQQHQYRQKSAHDTRLRSRNIPPPRRNSVSSYGRWLQLRFDFDSTAVRPRYAHSTTHVTTGLLHCGINK